MVKFWHAVDVTQPSLLGTFYSANLGNYLQQFSVEEINRLTSALLGYVLHIYSYKQFSRFVNFLSIGQQHAIRKSAIADSKVSLSLKLALISCRDYADWPSSTHFTIFSRCGLNRNDLQLWESLPTMGLPLQRLAKYKVLYPDLVQQDCEVMLSSLTVWMKKFVARKLSFVAKYNNFTNDDLLQDLRMKAISTYYDSYPFLSGAYLLNTVKRSVHNHGIRLIYHYGYHCRRRIYQDDTGNFIPIVNTVNNVGEGGDGDNEFSLLTYLTTDDLDPQAGIIVSADSMNLANGTAYQRVEDRMHWERIVKTADGARRIALGILTLQPNRAFVAYVNAQRRRKCKTVTEIAMTCRNNIAEFYNWIANFLDIPVLTVRRYIWETTHGISRSTIKSSPKTIPITLRISPPLLRAA